MADKLTKLQYQALVLLARKGGACPGCDEATKGLSDRMATKLVCVGLANDHSGRGSVNYKITPRGLRAVEAYEQTKRQKT